MGFPGASVCKAFTCNAGDPDSIPGLGRSPGEEHGNPFQYSCPGKSHGEEPGRLWSMGLQRVGHNLATEPPPNQHLVRIHCETWPQIHILPVTQEFESLAKLSCFGQDLALFPLLMICSSIVKTIDHASSFCGSPSFPAWLSNSFGIGLTHFSPCGWESSMFSWTLSNYMLLDLFFSFLFTYTSVMTRYKFIGCFQSGRDPRRHWFQLLGRYLK